MLDDHGRASESCQSAGKKSTRKKKMRAILNDMRQCVVREKGGVTGC